MASSIHCDVCEMRFLHKSKYDRHVKNTAHKRRKMVHLYDISDEATCEVNDVYNNDDMDCTDHYEVESASSSNDELIVETNYDELHVIGNSIHVAPAWFEQCELEDNLGMM